MINEIPDSVRAAWKYICQLRSQAERNRASLVLGAGISVDLNLPNWEILIERIKTVVGNRVTQANHINDPPGKAALILFEMFCSYRKEEIQRIPEYSNSFLVEKKLLSEWREMIHAELYADVQNDRRGLVDTHPYFKEIIKFVQKSEITVNYNFDDFIEFGLSQDDLNPTKHERPYQTVWSHQAQFTKDRSVIYHPNGFLPFDSKKFQSENIVFSDGSFADQLLEGMAGNFSTLLHVLTKKTSVLIGHSLTDSTLLHLLRKAASISPGNYNYFIQFSKAKLDDGTESAIFEANFNNYNLITLFFDSSDIKSFLSCLTMSEVDFLEMSDFLGLKTKYIYYLVGAVGIGKSTALSQFGSLTTLDEWFDERPTEMAFAPDLLGEESAAAIENWTNEQFRKKNNYLHRKDVGVILVDRSPLDPLSFVEESDRSKRARSMIEYGIRPGMSTMKVVPGVVLVMNGEPNEIWCRLITKRKEDSWPPLKIEKLQNRSNNIYSSLHPEFIYATQRREVEVIRDLAKVIFSKTYSPADLDTRLCEIANEN
ncbi:SIR2 family protein [Pseudomonas sp. NPDC077408]